MPIEIKINAETAAAARDEMRALLGLTVYDELTQQAGLPVSDVKTSPTTAEKQKAALAPEWTPVEAAQTLPPATGDAKEGPMQTDPEPQEALVAAGAPVPPPAPAPVAVGADVERDKNGFVWDERIHAGTKAKNQDGTWRYLRGVDKALVERVEAEMKAANAQRTVEALAEPAQAAAPAAPPPPAVEQTAAQTFATPEPTPAPATTPAPPPADSQPVTLIDLMKRITAGQTAGILLGADLAAILGAHGLPHIGALSQNPNLLPSVDAALKAKGV